MPHILEANEQSELSQCRWSPLPIDIRNTESSVRFRPLGKEWRGVWADRGGKEEVGHQNSHWTKHNEGSCYLMKLVVVRHTLSGATQISYAARHDDGWWRKRGTHGSVAVPTRRPLVRETPSDEAVRTLQAFVRSPCFKDISRKITLPYPKSAYPKFFPF
ncbi:hypothetical protein EVAR_29619_1 [Eumeta japonica]|uniref:Uncharacterized protein n=1 Tax=Eumeta variegata TaxID=151549 RepID=A0A4C1VUZ7_EUMVA|nr:hypothetical protein EVAR_29619_1 [Eumeta japonica]